MDLSIIIPARNEEFLQRTVDDILAKMKGNTEVIVILDGYWPNPGIKQHPKVTIIHLEEPIGQRAATNMGVKLSRAKYIMKCDAHCMFDEGFDIKLMADCEYNWIVLPRMYTLNAFEWVCACGHRHHQGPPLEKCEKCGGNEITREIVYLPRDRKTDYMWFDTDLRVRYFDGPGLRPYGDDLKEVKKKYSHYKREWARGEITDVLCGVGACWFLHRNYYWELGGLDENHGSWGQMAVEIALKTWLSGGRHVVNKKTWFAHLFRTQGKGFSFPYRNPAKDQEKARTYSRDLWLNNKWEGQKINLQWLINKFSPLPGWEEKKPSYKKKSLFKGVVYYTDNRCEERIAAVVRDQIKKGIKNGYELIAVSQYPINFGRNILMDLERSVLSMFKQILTGLEYISADIIYLCEHDVIYHPSHFDFTPSKKDVYYYNKNIWALNAKDGQALHYDGMKQVSGLVAYRDLLLEHYRKRVERVEKEGFTRKMGFEPGKPLPRGVDNYKYEYFESEGPNIDIKNLSSNLTRGRFRLDQYRCREKIKDTWVLAEGIPKWGKTKNRFDRFIRELQATSTG